MTARKDREKSFSVIGRTDDRAVGSLGERVRAHCLFLFAISPFFFLRAYARRRFFLSLIPVFVVSLIEMIAGQTLGRMKSGGEQHTCTGWRYSFDNQTLVSFTVPTCLSTYCILIEARWIPLCPTLETYDVSLRCGASLRRRMIPELMGPEIFTRWWRGEMNQTSLANILGVDVRAIAGPMNVRIRFRVHMRSAS